MKVSRRARLKPFFFLPWLMQHIEIYVDRFIIWLYFKLKMYFLALESLLSFHSELPSKLIPRT